jgi:hypothetical protein
MRLLRAKREPEKLFDTLGNSVAALSGGANRSKLVKGGLIAGVVAGLTAASAAISSVRRRREGNAS